MNKEVMDKEYKKAIKDLNYKCGSLYNLRCSILHKGKFDKADGKSTKERKNLSNFKFCYDGCHKVGILQYNESIERNVTIYIGTLCSQIVESATNFYNKSGDIVKEILDYDEIEFINMKKK